MTPQQTLGVDPILMEVVLNAFMALCDESQAILVRSAYSTNIKERKDCSAWLLDRYVSPSAAGATPDRGSLGHSWRLHDSHIHKRLHGSTLAPPTDEKATGRSWFDKLTMSGRKGGNPPPARI